MSLHFGGRKISEVYYGGKKIKEAYWGDRLIYSAVPDYPAWAASVVYKKGDRVVHDGHAYEATAPHYSSRANSPWGKADSSYWRYLGGSDRGEWKSGVLYDVGDTVTAKGNRYRVLEDHYSTPLTHPERSYTSGTGSLLFERF